MGRATPASGPTVHPRLTSELPGARCRRHTCSQPARLEPSSRKLSCNPRTPPSSVRKRRGVLTRVGGRVAPFPPHPQSRGARPSHPCPYLRRGGPGAPAGRAGRAARAGTAGPCSAPGRAASAGARARAGPAGGSGGGSACCRLAGVWGGGKEQRGAAVRRGSRLPPAPGAPGKGETPETGSPAALQEPVAASRGKARSSQPGPDPDPAATHRWPGTPVSKETGVSAVPPAAPPAFHRLPRPPPGAHEVGGDPEAGDGGPGPGQHQQQRGGNGEQHRAPHGRGAAAAPRPAPGRPRRIPPPARAAPPLSPPAPLPGGASCGADTRGSVEAALFP